MLMYESGARDITLPRLEQFGWYPCALYSVTDFLVVLVEKR